MVSRNRFLAIGGGGYGYEGSAGVGTQTGWQTGQSSESSVPLPEPAVMAVYGHAWQRMKSHFVSLLLIAIVYFAISLVVGGILGGFGGATGGDRAAGGSGAAGLLNLAYQFLVGLPLGYGGAYAFLRAARGFNPEVSDLLYAFKNVYLSSVLAGLLMTVIIGIGMILLVIPGIIAAVRLSFVPFLVVDEHLGPTEAIQASWQRTRGYGWTILGIALLSIPISIIGLMLLVVGLVPASILIYLAFATMYAAVMARSPRE